MDSKRKKKYDYRGWKAHMPESLCASASTNCDSTPNSLARAPKASVVPLGCEGGGVRGMLG